MIHMIHSLKNWSVGDKMYACLVGFHVYYFVGEIIIILLRFVPPRLHFCGMRPVEKHHQLTICEFLHV